MSSEPNLDGKKCGTLLPFPTSGVESFYQQVLSDLLNANIPFLVAGGYAVGAYTGISRPTKDLDIFTTPGNFPRLLSYLKHKGHRVAIEDERWIGKIHCDGEYVDVIFGAANGMVPIRDDWFDCAHQMDIFGLRAPLVSPTDLLWSKALIKDRRRYDGADIAHIILKQCDVLDWNRLLGHMDAHWEVLFSLILEFRWIYPNERDCIPLWLIDALMQRLLRQLELPKPERRVCRGRLFSRSDYKHAIEEWGYADIGGEEKLADE